MISPFENVPVEPSRESIDSSKSEAVELLAEFADKYDYEHFSFESLYLYLKSFRTEILSGGNTINLDIDSFSNQELEDIYQSIDAKLEQRRRELIDNVDMETDEGRLLSSESRLWEMGYDGKVKPKVQTAVLLGGVHGDERTLPEQLDKLVRHNEKTRDFHIDHSRVYINSKVNVPALENNTRAFSVDKGQLSEDADLNRSEISDSYTAGIKNELLEEILRLDKPFVLDMHNDRETIDPHAVIIGGEIVGAVDERLLFKIRLAMELGIGRIIIADPEIAKGTMISEVGSRDVDADGMVIEVNTDDKKFESAKIALKFLSGAGVVNDGRPSTQVMMQKELESAFALPKSEGEVEIVQYSLNRDIDRDLSPANPVMGVEYMVLNGFPVVIRKLKLDGQILREV